ncbi:MAG: hypothetical protein H6870_18220 [Methylobacteriaceae bacterium]|nr:hypothetical protein [Methylobacteriaceae bacterium]
MQEPCSHCSGRGRLAKRMPFPNQHKHTGQFIDCAMCGGAGFTSEVAFAADRPAGYRPQIEDINDYERLASCAPERFAELRF